MANLLPTDTGYVSCSWACHLDRNPPSSEAGTDYGSGYGSSVYAVDNATVINTYGNSGATGRFVEYQLDNGQTTRTLHLSQVLVSKGQRVSRGQVIAISGASGFGDDWYYGPHAHQTLWDGTAFCCPTIDFALSVGDSQGGEDDMTPAQADQLNNIFNAIFYGGPSMPDKGLSIGQSLADLLAGQRPIVSRVNPDGSGLEVSWIQELADAKTLAMSSDGKLNTLVDRPPISDEQVVFLAEAISQSLLEAGVGGASAEQVQQIIVEALGTLVLVSQGGASDGR